MQAKLALAVQLLAATLLLPVPVGAQEVGRGYGPGHRVLMDAHNCYPYFEWWDDRIDRALSTGTPLAIEQDLYWFKDPKSGKSRSLVAHGDPFEGSEPTMRDYFFERIRPIVERALRESDHRDWPIITLNLDLKTEEPEHLESIWKLLLEYQERLLVFGATPTHLNDPLAAPEILEPAAADNYHRWWNNFWGVVEAGGPSKAGEWTPSKDERLHALVQYAHKQGLWIRFYTLNGVTVPQLSSLGLFRNYNFSSREAVEKRWVAAIEAGVDFIASDQYEDLADFIRKRN